jgi:hypothetical protein
MRIIKDNATLYHELVTHGEMRDYYHDGYKESDTIEITDAEWDEIGMAYFSHVETYIQSSDTLAEAERHIKPFSQYIKSLISLIGEGR